MLWSSIFFASAAVASPYQDGDLIFQESGSAQSMAIQEATASRWSHVGILFHEKGQWIIAEALNSSTRFSTPRRASKWVSFKNFAI